MADAALAGAQGILQGGATPDASLAGAQNLLAATAPAQQANAAPVVTNPYLANIEAGNREQQELEQRHGKAATIATQAARGALDFVMAPAALLGAGLEGAGSLTGWRGLEDFGRDFGSDAQGSEAMATIFNPSVMAAPSKGLDSYQEAKRNIAEQQQAWPMLSTISHAAGMVAAGVGVGALAGAGGVAVGAGGEALAPAGTALTRIAGAAGMGAYEGAGSGAQAAYADNRPLRDVLGSTLMGGLMGGVTAGAFQGGAEAFRSPWAADALEGFSRERTGKAIGIIQNVRKKLGGSDEVDRLVKDVSGYVMDDGQTVLPKTLLKAGTISQTEIADRISQAAEETGAKLGNMRRSVSDFVDSSEPTLRPKLSDLDDTVGKIAKELEDNPQLSSRAGELRKVLEHAASKADEDGTISLNDLREVQESIKRRIYPKDKLGSVVPEAKEELQQAERSIEDVIEGTIDKALPKMDKGEAGAYRELRRVTRSFIQADKIAQDAVGRQAGNRFHSLTDTMAGAATFAGDIATGGPLLAGAKALGVSTLHKYAREHGSMFLSALTEKLAGASRRFAAPLADAAESVAGPELAASSLTGGLFRGALAGHDSQYVSVDAAGGRQAQTVIASLARAREHVNDAVEAAGPNPVAREAAQRLAQQRVADELANKAGPFDPVTWQQVPPTPLQKVLHRSEILSQVSADLAHSTAQAHSLLPDPNIQLNPDRVRKLTKDANGPLAIGGVQAAVKELFQSAPPTPTGDQAKLAAREAFHRLAGSTDTADAMLMGHEFAAQLSSLAAGARDVATQSFIGRAVAQIREQLSAPEFGKAGALYGKLTAQPDPNAQQLTDPNAIRGALKAADGQVGTPEALRPLTDSILAAHDAKKQFGGGGTDKGISRQLGELADKFKAAQDAVTLDGGPAGRVFDFFTDKPGADARGLKGAPETIVLNAVRPQMERMLPVLGKENDRYTGDPEKPSHPEPAKSTGELQSLYRERMDNLAQTVNSPDPDAIAESLKGLPNIPPDVATAVATDAHQRMAQLLADMPKPNASIRGKAFETLSSSDLRKANAMWEATTKPMSVFSDFHSGTIDYDKAQYAWKQYPGLQQAAQAGLMDALHAHLSDDERAAIPDSTLTQLDYLLGFNGALQTSVDRGFSSRMTAIGQQQQEQSKSPQGNQLELESSKPTFTERLAQARKG